jgi:hypothetical protein
MARVEGSHKKWIGMENPCSACDIEVFYAATFITVGADQKTPFWEAPWLDGMKPKDTYTLIFTASKRKKWNMRIDMHDDVWIKKVALDRNFMMDHDIQFVEL